ncbi:MAG: MBL fold metallo-hydrolase RNA specificity domain-containing protein, partial [Patescibacteria group bacterium]
YLIMESVYGDRNHESRSDRRNMLAKVIKDNYKRKGALLIPTFSLERSQELLFELNNLLEEKKIPIMPIYLDSPLAIQLTEIFKNNKDYFNNTAKKVLSKDKYLFDFPGLHSTLHSEESKLINESPNPKVIIAGSGMSSGGRIVHHERHFLPDPNNTILLTGYQAVGTLGRFILDGVKRVRITGEDVEVRARVENILGYSGHKDSDGLLQFVSDLEEKVQKIFVVMGEPKSAMFLVQKIKDNLGLKAYAPMQGDSALLHF